jgi:hypothetical protein
MGVVAVWDCSPDTGFQLLSQLCLKSQGFPGPVGCVERGLWTCLCNDAVNSWLFDIEGCCQQRLWGVWEGGDTLGAWATWTHSRLEYTACITAYFHAATTAQLAQWCIPFRGQDTSRCGQRTLRRRNHFKICVIPHSLIVSGCMVEGVAEEDSYTARFSFKIPTSVVACRG